MWNLTNKKAQLLDRPFIFIFVLVVAAFTFIFGFYLINNLIKTSNCTQLGIFFNDLKIGIERYYNFDIGSSTEISLKLPKKIEYVCFSNIGNELDKNSLDNIQNGLYDVLMNSNYNLVFVPINYCTRAFFKIDKLRVNENPLCILNTGNIKLKLKNIGDSVEITKT